MVCADPGQRPGLNRGGLLRRAFNQMGWFLVDKSVEDLVVMLGFWPPLKVGVLVREGLFLIYAFLLTIY